MQETYNEGLVENPTKRNPKWGIYQEQRLTTAGMSEMPQFESRFKQYLFQWMTTTLDKFTPALVWEFYVAYKGEMKWPYPHGNLWKGGEVLTSLTIRVV